MNSEEHQQQLTTALAQVMLPLGIEIRPWSEADFPTIQQLSLAEGWTSPTQRTADSLLAWQHSWPALVAVEGERVVGFVRGLTDGAITISVKLSQIVLEHEKKEAEAGSFCYSKSNDTILTSQEETYASVNASYCTTPVWTPASPH